MNDASDPPVTPPEIDSTVRNRESDRVDYPEVELPQPLRAPFRQIVFWSGLLCVGLAGLGVVLPLLPTTPLLIVAAACFARTDPRFHRWLLTNRMFGPLICDWQQHRCIPLRAKILTVIMVGLVGGSSVVFFIPLLPVQILVAAMLVGLLAWILSHPSVPPISEKSVSPPQLGKTQTNTKEEQPMARRRIHGKRDIEVNYPRRQFIQKLRRLADCLENEERFRIQIAGQRISIPPNATINIEHERGTAEEEIEFQLTWKNES